MKRIIKYRSDGLDPWEAYGKNNNKPKLPRPDPVALASAIKASSALNKVFKINPHTSKPYDIKPFKAETDKNGVVVITVSSFNTWDSEKFLKLRKLYKKEVFLFKFNPQTYSRLNK